MDEGEEMAVEVTLELDIAEDVRAGAVHSHRTDGKGVNKVSTRSEHLLISCWAQAVVLSPTL